MHTKAEAAVEKRIEIIIQVQFSVHGVILDLPMLPEGLTFHVKLRHRTSENRPRVLALANCQELHDRKSALLFGGSVSDKHPLQYA